MAGLSALADACALIAFHAGGGSMTARGLGAMRGEDVLIASITVWEITRKAAIGKLPPLPLGPDRTFAGFLRSRGYRVATLNWQEAEHANNLPLHHADPMDRMLIATALLRHLPIVTSDSQFPIYGVEVIW